MTAATKDYPHGYARYKLQNCRCYTCCFAVSGYSRARDRAIAEGRWRADVEPVRVHLRSLMAAGMGYKLVAARAGLNTSTVSRLLYGRPDRGTPPPTTTRFDIAQRILAVGVDLHDNTPVEATGTVRRIQALVALGHTLTSVAQGIGWTVRNLSTLVHKGSVPYAGRVEVRTARAVADLYDRLSMVRPEGHSATRARRFAASRGWVPPLAWDDEQLDDPAAVPVEAAPAGRRAA